jgi:hypothetical protein
MPNTYVALATQTLGSAAASVTFSSISSAYTDLVVVMTTKLTSGADGINLQFNGDTGTNYSFTYLSGSGSSATSGRFANTSNIKVAFNGYPTTADGHNSIVQVNNYSNATTFKTVLTRDNNANNGTGAIVGTWRNTAAVTSVVLTAVSSTFTAGSTFSLYGIAASGAGLAKATGGTISYGGDGYIYHTFTSSGTFTPTSSLTADVLVVAGGGGGGGSFAGGGGAGGLLAFTSQSLTATGYTCTVGAGGSGGAANTNGSTASDSQFGALTLVKGGGGGGNGGGSSSNTGLNGGSGGGGGRNAFNGPSNAPGGTATSGQGTNGGNYVNGVGSNTGAGGGGSSVAGFDATTSGGAGGNGVTTYSSWGSVTNTGQDVSGTRYYAGGGGGGAFSGNVAAGVGGLGGGAAGGYGVSGSSGTANTGGGGGGGGGNTSFLGGAGGSGIVIIRYLG